MKRTVNIGVAGCGRIARLVHLDALARLPGVRVVAAADADPKRLAEAKRRLPGAALYPDYRHLVENPGVEALVICLPPALHAAAALTALAAGKHVYVEKPIAIDLEQARAVIRAWRESGLVGMMGFNYRHSWQYREAKRCLHSGRLGALVGARSMFASRADALPAWKQMRAQGGGVLLDLASHHVDAVRFLLEQEVVEVSAAAGSRRSEIDTATLHLRLADGLLVQSSFFLNAVDEDRFEIYGEAGKLTLDRYAGTVEVTAPVFEYGRVPQTRRALRGLVHRVAGALRAPGEGSFRTALAAFVAAVGDGRPASPDLEDGYRSLAVVMAAEEAARHGRAVRLDGTERRPGA